MRVVQSDKVKLLRTKNKPEYDVEVDLMEIACQSFERIQEWYGDGGLKRCLEFVHSRFTPKE